MTTSSAEPTLSTPTATQTQRARAVTHRTRGRSHGPITRLVSPSDLGELLKPFVFLDIFELDGARAPSLDFGWHPHSGIATVSVLFEGTSRFAETTGHSGELPAGGVEWMRAGGGVWHTGSALPGRVRGFQLWVALPPDLENAASESHYVKPEEVPEQGGVRVILGTYQGLTSPIGAPPMTYLSVTLRDGARWTFEPPKGHDVAWVALMDGALETSSVLSRGEVAVFERSESAIEFVARGETRFVLGSAPRHPHRLVLGDYSVHTSAEALRKGEEEIVRIGRELRAQGKSSYALNTRVG